MTEAENNNEVENTEEEVAVEATPEVIKDDGLAEGAGADFKWYIAKTLTGQENKIAKTLRERIINHKLGEFFSQILVPEESVTTHAGGKKRTIKKKFFPGYILVKMVMTDKTWHLVNATDKITG